MVDVRAALSIPAIYRAFQRIVASEDAQVRLVRDLIGVKAGDRVLDIGCGPGDLLGRAPPIDYCGIDISQPYIDEAVKRHGPGVRFLVRSAASDLSDLGRFDVAITLGVLHHLDDGEVATALASVRRALNPGGRFVALEPVYTPDQSRIAKWLIDRDRGDHVREREAYFALARRHFDDVGTTIYDNLTRIPYTHVLIECRT